MDGPRVVASALIDVVGPTSVLDVGSDGEWEAAFRAAGIDDIESTGNDLRSPLVFDRRFDLAVCTGVADRLPFDVVPGLVASLVHAADVVAFAATLPGADAPEEPDRWPAWWDSLFEQRGYRAHDLVRWQLWDDQRVDLLVRGGLVLYAAADRFGDAPMERAVVRSVVHPEAHHRALHLARRELDVERRSAGVRIAELDAAVANAKEQARLDAGDLEVALTRLAELERIGEVADVPAVEAQLLRAENEAARNRSDAVLVWSALVNAQRELAAASTAGLPSIDSLRSSPKRQVVRLVTTLLPLRSSLARVLGPPARLFDEHWYVTQHPDVVDSVLSPLWHYRRHGAAMRRSPVPFFDPAWYIERYPAVAASGVDPFEHYLRRGWRDGLDPHPLFSTPWYRVKNDLGRWRRSPLEHFLRVGRAGGASPHPLIDPDWYLRTNRDVAKSGVSAVDHFLTRGWWEGRSPHPLFDLRWYLDTYLDVAGTGENPLVQYLRHGWREGRDPNPLFDTSWYLESYPDVAEADVEPLGHYLVTGAAEGRATGPLFDTAWYVAANPDAATDEHTPLAYFLEIGAARGDSPSPWADELASAAADGEQRFRVQHRHPVPRVLL
jgi:hypothetical protein